MIIYKTTNLINGKIYVGYDTHNDPNYLGSGVLLKKAINKNGIENFKKEILEECKTFDELLEREVYWIEKLDARNQEIGYNILKGGRGLDPESISTIMKELHKDPEFSKAHRQRTKDRWDDPNSIFHTEEYKESLSKGNKAKWTTEYREKMKNILNSEETLQKKSEASRKMWEQPEYKKKMKELYATDEYIEKQKKVQNEYWNSDEGIKQRERLKEINTTIWSQEKRKEHGRIMSELSGIILVDISTGITYKSKKEYIVKNNSNYYSVDKMIKENKLIIKNKK